MVRGAFLVAAARLEPREKPDSLRDSVLCAVFWKEYPRLLVACLLDKFSLNRGRGSLVGLPPMILCDGYTHIYMRHKCIYGGLT